MIQQHQACSHWLRSWHFFPWGYRAPCLRSLPLWQTIALMSSCRRSRGSPEPIDQLTPISVLSCIWGRPDSQQAMSCVLTGKAAKTFQDWKLHGDRSSTDIPSLCLLPAEKGGSGVLASPLLTRGWVSSPALSAFTSTLLTPAASVLWLTSILGWRFWSQ